MVSLGLSDSSLVTFKFRGDGVFLSADAGVATSLEAFLEGNFILLPGGLFLLLFLRAALGVESVARFCDYSRDAYAKKSN